MATVNKSVIKLMLMRTELSNNLDLAYQIRHADGNSGWSFSQPQWDLIKRL